jgi:hypothetical protein
VLAAKAGPNAGDTHEFLAVVLGVRRGGISIAAALQRQGLVKCHRGEIKTLNAAAWKKRLAAVARDRKVYGTLLH